MWEVLGSLQYLLYADTDTTAVASFDCCAAGNVGGRKITPNDFAGGHPPAFRVFLQALEMEPSLSPDIVGAWWFPQDMSIDAQRMFRVLEQACSKGGVEILQG